MGGENKGIIEELFGLNQFIQGPYATVCSRKTWNLWLCLFAHNIVPFHYALPTQQIYSVAYVVIGLAMEFWDQLEEDYEVKNLENRILFDLKKSSLRLHGADKYSTKRTA